MQLSDAAIEALSHIQTELVDRIEPRLELLLGCLKELPQEKRDLLMQCYAFRGGVSQLALRLHIEADTLYKRVERIRKILFECMEKDR
jgi:RNA polymerase sigma-70 factor (ECF subfamily)